MTTLSSFLNRIIFLFIVSIGTAQFLHAQTPQLPLTDWTRIYWPAKWIVHPTAPAKQYGVFHFRKVIDLPQTPTRFVVHISAVIRAKLLLQGGRDLVRLEHAVSAFRHQHVLHDRKMRRERLSVAVTNEHRTIFEEAVGLADLNVVPGKEGEKRRLKALTTGRGRGFQEQRRFSGRQELGSHRCNLP